MFCNGSLKLYSVSYLGNRHPNLGSQMAIYIVNWIEAKIEESKLRFLLYQFSSQGITINSTRDL